MPFARAVYAVIFFQTLVSFNNWLTFATSYEERGNTLIDFTKIKWKWIQNFPFSSHFNREFFVWFCSFQIDFPFMSFTLFIKLVSISLSVDFIIIDLALLKNTNTWNEQIQVPTISIVVEAKENWIGLWNDTSKTNQLQKCKQLKCLWFFSHDTAPHLFWYCLYFIPCKQNRNQTITNF